MAANSTNEVYDEDNCPYSPQIFLPWKMAFVGGLGFTTAIVSILHNILLFYTFNTSKRLRQRNLVYLMWISLCDIFISISYIAIMCVQVYIDWFVSLPLFILWNKYLVLAFTVSHITLSSSGYLLMAVTIERYLQTTGDTRATRLFKFLSSHRGLVVLFCFFSGIVIRGSVFLEIQIVVDPECEGFASMWATISPLTDSPLFDTIWKFWIRKIFSVFLPFIVLAYFNVAIVRNVRRTDRDQTVKTLILYVTVGNRGDTGRLRSRLRTVTRMLVMVISCYLCANILDVLIAAWENIDPESLQSNQIVYTVSSDISSFLPILACALRLPIYIANDHQIRQEIRISLYTVLLKCCGCCRCIAEGARTRKKLETVISDRLVHTQTVRESTHPDSRHPDHAFNCANHGMGRLIMARATLIDQNGKETNEPVTYL